MTIIRDLIARIDWKTWLDLSQFLANVGIVATALFIFVQFKTAVDQLNETTKEFSANARNLKHGRTLEYIRRHNEKSPELAAIFKRFKNPALSEADKLKIFEEEPGVSSLIRLELNFFEEMGIAHKHDLVENEILFAFFGMIVPTTYDRFRFYIDDRKAKDRSAAKLFENFAALDGEFRRLLKKD